MNIKKPFRQGFFYVILIVIPFICIELAMRLFMAIWIDPNILFFGTGLVRTEIQRQIDPMGYSGRDEYKYKKIKRAVDKADAADVIGERLYCGNYSKYFPGETRIDFDEKGDKFVIKMNNKGFRVPDISDKKDSGTIRIITLGASSTFGYHDRDNETYPYYLQEILNEKLKKHHINNINKFEVINLGIPGLTIENIYSLFINEALPLNPDLVTFYEGHNNVFCEQDLGDLKKRYTHNKFYKFILITYREISHRSLLWHFTTNLANNIFTKYNVSDLAMDKQIYNGSLISNSMELPVFFEVISQNMAKRQEAMTSSFLINLNMINLECKKHHAFFMVANQQITSTTFAHEKLKGKTYQDEVLFVINRLKDNKDITSHQLFLLKHAILMKELKLWALKENVAFVDIIKALDQDRDTILTSVHLNPRGNKIIAQEFAGKIFDYFSN